MPQPEKLILPYPEPTADDIAAAQSLVNQICAGDGYTYEERRRDAMAIANVRAANQYRDQCDKPWMSQMDEVHLCGGRWALSDRGSMD